MSVDPDLLESPYEPHPSYRMRPVWILVSLVLAAAVLGWVVVRSGVGVEEAPRVQGQIQNEDNTQSLGSAPLTTVADEIVLAPFASEPPLIHHPTALPNSWRTCRIVGDPSWGDRFCDPTDDSRYIQVAVVTDRKMSGTASVPLDEDPNRGHLISKGASNKIAYDRGPVRIVVSSSDDTISIQTLVSVAGSIPIVEDFGILRGKPEPRFPIDDIDNATLEDALSDILTDPTAKIRAQNLELRVTSDNTLVFGFYADGWSVIDMFPSIEKPRLVAGDRPILVGEFTDTGRAVAIWDQAGYGWRVEGQLSTEDVAFLANEIITRLADLQ